MIDLVGKQIKCYKDVSHIDENALSILQMLYPMYSIVKTVFEIEYDRPFIYIGDLRYINAVNKRTEPHIIVATTGEYDFTDRDTLIKFAYQYHNKNVPNYMKDVYKSWNDEQFFNNIKLIIVNGVPKDRDINNDIMFLNILNNITNPIKLIQDYFKDVTDSNINYIENDLLSFISRSRNINISNIKGDKSLKLRLVFKSICDKNIEYAISNLLDNNIDNIELRNLNFLLDLCWRNRY